MRSSAAWSHSKFDGYQLMDQWTSYGWNVFTIADGHDYGQIAATS